MRYDYGDGDAGKAAVAEGERSYTCSFGRTDGDVWLKLSDLTADVRRLQERMLAIEAKLDAGYYMPATFTAEYLERQNAATQDKRDAMEAAGAA